LHRGRVRQLDTEVDARKEREEALVAALGRDRADTHLLLSRAADMQAAGLRARAAAVDAALREIGLGEARTHVAVLKVCLVAVSVAVFVLLFWVGVFLFACSYIPYRSESHCLCVVSLHV
jgi:hypothetical protein